MSATATCLLCALCIAEIEASWWLDNNHKSQPWVQTSWKYTRDVVVRMDVQRVESYKRNMEVLYLIRKKCKPREATLVPPEVCPPEKIYRWYVLKHDKNKQYKHEVSELEEKCKAIDEIIAKIKKLDECKDKFFQGKMKATMTVVFTTRPTEVVVIVHDLPKTWEDMPEMVKLLSVMGMTIPIAIFMIVTCKVLKRLGVSKQNVFEEKEAVVLTRGGGKTEKAKSKKLDVEKAEIGEMENGGVDRV